MLMLPATAVLLIKSSEKTDLFIIIQLGSK